MKKPNFVLSRKNQQGQVAIFVALIFQVIFVFFALLINVGLLVHHKINLQQSTDLAAYYGAMKQAESLNAMAHVNYQLRQAWKLLTWRYRVLGTFGLQRADKVSQPTMPVTLLYGALPSKINSDADVQFPAPGACPSGINTADTPFFCIGHAGFKGWSGGGNENICRVDCSIIDSAPYQVNGVKIPQVSGTTGTSIAQTLTGVNVNLADRCKGTGPANIKVLARMILAYRQEMQVRSQTLLMLAGNLSNEAKELLDLDGNSVVKGATATLKNNLTEANNSSDDLKINFYSSLSGAQCGIDKSNPGSNHVGKKEFIKRIEFDFINFYMHDCQGSSLSNPVILNYIAGSIFQADLGGLSKGIPNTTVNAFTTQALEDELMSLISKNDHKFAVGYEKNPWCPVYFVAQATSKPRIPFLPLSEIQINAVSVAKPFGGSLGPWYGNTWDSNAATSQENLTINDVSKQTDEMLPTVHRPTSITPTLKDSRRMLLNFSRYVGDKKGVSDVSYLAEYHAALINRGPASSTLYGSSMPSENPGTGTLSPPSDSPDLSSWDNTTDMDNILSYDPLTRGTGTSSSFLRNLEISAIAPNQFDLTYYSIDPDFYNNYYKRISGLSDPSIFTKLNNASGGIGPSKAIYVRPDFGNNKDIYKRMPEFSVRNQIEIFKNTFVDSPANTQLQGPPHSFADVYPEIARRQSSLLTGWTFGSFTDFDTFPGPGMTPAPQTMSFATCSDQWQSTGLNPEYKNPTETDSKLPPTPGNCVTGGRVGYSVKLVSPSSLSATMTPQALGGVGAPAGVILNPIPVDFLNNF